MLLQPRNQRNWTEPILFERILIVTCLHLFPQFIAFRRGGRLLWSSADYLWVHKVRWSDLRCWATGGSFSNVKLCNWCCSYHPLKLQFSCYSRGYSLHTYRSDWWNPLLSGWKWPRSTTALGFELFWSGRSGLEINDYENPFAFRLKMTT